MSMHFHEVMIMEVLKGRTRAIYIWALPGMHAAAALEDPDPVRTSMHCIDMWLERLVIAEHLCS